MKCGFYFYKVARNMISGLSYCSHKSQSPTELKELKQIDSTDFGTEWNLFSFSLHLFLTLNHASWKEPLV